MPVSLVRVITGMDSIDLELRRRRAGLAVSFLIELISRFRSHQCSMRLTLFLLRQFLGKQPQRHRMPFFRRAKHHVRLPRLRDSFWSSSSLIYVNALQQLSLMDFAQLGRQIAKTPIRAATSASSSQLPPGAWPKAIDCWIKS
jgi:hypothetical protein